MKAAEHWLEEMKLRPCVTENDLLVIIKRIQADASALPESIQEALNSGDGTYNP